MKRMALLISSLLIGMAFFLEYQTRVAAIDSAFSPGNNDTFIVMTMGFHPNESDKILNQNLGIEKEFSDVGIYLENDKILIKHLRVNGDVIREISINLNNFGLISNFDYTLEKDSDEYRIIVLGQEQTAPTTSQKAWPDHLNDILNEDPALKKKLGVKKVSVYNFGWPDARMLDYGFLIDKVNRFQPDLVLLNLVSSDLLLFLPRKSFLSTSTAEKITGTLRGLENVSPNESPSESIYIRLKCSRLPISLDNPACSLGRPFGLYVGSEVFDDSSRLQDAMTTVRKRFIEGAVKNTFLPLSIMRWFWPDLDPERIRFFYSPRWTVEKMDESERMEIIVSELKKLNRSFPRFAVGHL